MEISARPHMNGNTRDDFLNAALSLSDSLSDISEAIGKINADVLNGRNYQHLEQIESWNARDADIAQMARVADAIRVLRELEGAILNIALESE